VKPARFAGIVVVAWVLATARGGVAEQSGQRESRELRGWSVLVHRDLLTADAVATTERALELLDAQLAEIERVVPAPAVARLREVPLHLSPEYEGVSPRAEYHPDPGWLREHGRDPAMARAVEFTNVRIFEAETVRMPNFALHELAHAYHHRVLPDGFDNADVRQAFDRATASGAYAAVERRNGGGRATTKERAYALTTPQEFFAETTEAFFSTNDFFPFTKANLARHDPETTALLTTLWGVVDAPATAAPPNVVILYADDMGYGDLGANNPASKIPTPHLDRLAAEGMRFTDAHSSSGHCSPSRYALLTGRHHWRDFHGIVNSLGPSVFKPGQLTLPAMLRDRGYATACIGKWHLGWDWNALRRPGTPPTSIEHGDFDWSKPIPDGPLAHGFDTYFGDDVINFPPYAWIENDRVVEAPDATLDKPAGRPKEGEWECRPGPARSDWDFYRVLPTITARAEAFVRSRQGNPQPFLLYFPLPSPHAPIIPNDEFGRLRGPDRRRLRPRARRAPRDGARREHDRGVYGRQRRRGLRLRPRHRLRPLVVGAVPRHQAGPLRGRAPRALPAQVAGRDEAGGGVRHAHLAGGPHGHARRRGGLRAAGRRRGRLARSASLAHRQGGRAAPHHDRP